MIFSENKIDISYEIAKFNELRNLILWNLGPLNISGHILLTDKASIHIFYQSYYGI